MYVQVYTWEEVHEEQLTYGGWRWSSILAPPSAQEVEQSRVFGGGGGGHELLKAGKSVCPLDQRQIKGQPGRVRTNDEELGFDSRPVRLTDFTAPP